jgi:diketogulonate reductase-like aldo/keto reductase/DNA-binding HxlR family transcriptional regulator
LAEQPTIPLRDGRAIPQLGFGVFQIAPGGDTQRAVAAALGAGYRHVDTAAVYRNEADVGAGIRSSGLESGSVWVTTKLANGDQGVATARRAFEASLERLGMDAVDLYLLHWPHERRLESWRVLEQLQGEGLARSIGVSNFLVRHLDELLAHANVPPAVNQIELSPFLYRSREDTLRSCAEERIAVEAYSPLTKGRRLDDSTVAAIAAEIGRTRPRCSACARADAALVRAFDLLGRRWTGVVLGTLSGGPAGFRALSRAVEGISDSVLSDRLSELSNVGLATRTVDEGPPISVAYELTDAGRALLPALEQITRWAEEHLPAADQSE